MSSIFLGTTIINTQEKKKTNKVHFRGAEEENASVEEMLPPQA